MKTINGTLHYTRDEAKNMVAARTEERGKNDSRMLDGLSYRWEGCPGTGGGTEAWSFIHPIRRAGITYYRMVDFAN